MNSKTRYLVEAALTVALTVALSRVKLFRMPQGGSITLEMIPLMVFALRWGFKGGAVAGLMTGVLELLLGGYMVHPVQAFLDYPLAFGVLAAAALWPRCIRWGMVVASLARLACHVASGVIFFSAYVPQGTHPLIYSLTYNGGYMAVNTLLALIITPLVVARLGKK